MWDLGSLPGVLAEEYYTESEESYAEVFGYVINVGLFL